MTLPDAVHHNAGCQGIVWAGQPGSQRAAPSGAVRAWGDGGGVRGQQGGESRRNSALGFPAGNGERRSHRTHVPGGHGCRWRTRFQRVEGCQFLAQRDQLLLGFAFDFAVHPLPFIKDLFPGQICDLPFLRGACSGRFFQQGLGFRREHGYCFPARILPFRRLDFRDALADSGGGMLPFFLLGSVFGLLGLGQDHRAVTGIQRGKKGLQPVVVRLQQRIEFMIMTTGALEAEPHEDIRRGVGDIIQDHIPLPGGITVVIFINPVPQITSGHQRLGITRKKFIARQLFAEEDVIGFVVIERGDHIIPVAPCVGAVVVGLVAIAVGIPHEVQPQTGLPFAVARAGQQPVHQFFPRIRRGIADISLHLFPAGRQTQQTKIDPPYEGRLRTLPCRLQTRALQPGQNKPVHRRPRPCRILHLRQGWFTHGLERPPRPVGFGKFLGSPRHDRRPRQQGRE